MSNVTRLNTRLPDSAYLEAGVFEREMVDLFAKSWLPVGRVDEITEPGAYFTWQRTRIPTLLVRSIDGQVRGFYNSCRHRGAPVVRTPTGRGRAFRCQYHSWTYDTFGSLMAVPDERDFGKVDRCAYSLVPLNLAQLGGWLWIDQSRAAGGLVDCLGPTATWLGSLPEYHSTNRVELTLASNWKGVVERLAELGGGAIGVPGELHWCSPNVSFANDGSGLRMIAAWPLDERSTILEIVTCAEGPVAPTIDADLQASLQAALGGLATTGGHRGSARHGRPGSGETLATGDAAGSVTHGVLSNSGAPRKLVALMRFWPGVEVDRRDTAVQAARRDCFDWTMALDAAATADNAAATVLDVAARLTGVASASKSCRGPDLGDPDDRQGYDWLDLDRRALGSPLSLWRGRDGWFLVQTNTPPAWRDFCATFLNRAAHVEAPAADAWKTGWINNLATTILDTHRVDDAVGTCLTYGIPAAVVGGWRDGEVDASALHLSRRLAWAALVDDLPEYATITGGEQ